MKVTCKECNKVHVVSLSDKFTGCDCGAKMAPELVDMLYDVNNRIEELCVSINQRATDGTGSMFELQI